MYSQACFYGSSCQAQLPEPPRFVFQKPFSLYFKSHKFKSVSTIDFIYFERYCRFHDLSLPSNPIMHWKLGEQLAIGFIICFYLLFRLLSNYAWLACLADRGFQYMIK